jgi:hypothetical protein
MPIILALKRLSQEDHEFRARLNYIKFQAILNYTASSKSM